MGAVLEHRGGVDVAITALLHRVLMEWGGGLDRFVMPVGGIFVGLLEVAPDPLTDSTEGGQAKGLRAGSLPRTALWAGLMRDAEGGGGTAAKGQGFECNHYTFTTARAPATDPITMPNGRCHSEGM